MRQRVSDYGYGSVKRLIDQREGKPLLVLSNLGIDAVSRLYDDRISSRLGGGTLVRVGNRDRRLEQRKEQATGPTANGKPSQFAATRQCTTGIPPIPVG